MSQFSRTNVSEIKSQIGKKLGRERSQRYFGLLNGLLSRKLSKVEFDKLCVQLVGRENLPLHNLLIRSILRNACQAKGISRNSGVFVKNLPVVDNAVSSPQTVNPAPNIFSNGDVLPPSPRKIRSGTQNRRVKDSLNSIGLDGKVDVDSPSSLQEAVCKENGDVSLYDLKGPLLNQLGVSAEHLVKRAWVDKGSMHDRSSVHNNSKSVEVVSIEDKEYVARRVDLDLSRGRLQAPLGIPCFAASISGANRSFLSSTFISMSSDSFSRNYNSGELCHTEILKKRMEKVAEVQGLEGVTLDCANLLKHWARCVS